MPDVDEIAISDTETFLHLLIILVLIPLLLNWRRDGWQGWLIAGSILIGFIPGGPRPARSAGWVSRICPGKPYRIIRGDLAASTDIPRLCHLAVVGFPRTAPSPRLVK